MAWLVIETFILVLIAVAIGVLIGMVLRRSIGAGARDGGMAAATAGGPAAAIDDHHGETSAEPVRPVPVEAAAPHPVEAEAAAPAPVTPADPVPEPAGTPASDPVVIADAPVSDTAAAQPAAPEPAAEPEAPTRATDAPPSAAADGIIDAGKAANADQVGVRPSALASARDNRPDDLKRVKGIGPQNEARLNALGIYHFDQIAAWRPEEARWVGTYLAFPGRIEREDWMSQARDLASNR